MLPQSIKKRLELTHEITILNSEPVAGGSINRAYKISTNKGVFFLKYNSSAPDDFFEKEAHGLQVLKAAGTALRIPEVIAVGNPGDPATQAFLLLEYIEEGQGGNSLAFGAGLAALHHTSSENFGLEINNYIGSMAQQNGEHDEWVPFFIGKRIEPQLKTAYDAGRLSKATNKHWNRLARQLNSIMPPCRPSLLHGDLWGGNYLFDKTGTAVLIDPAVYYGHPEMDLAFTKMFGGFSADFYDGYESVTPLEPGFEDRVVVYNLYPLLVHVNLFGGHYISQFQRVMNSF